MRKIMVCSLVLLMTLSPAASAAQDRSDPVKALAGDSKKEWVLTRLETFMGDKNKCKSGESWTFQRDGVVQIKRCVNGQFTPVPKRWNVGSSSTGILMITVGDMKRRLIFSNRSTPKVEEIILRDMTPERTSRKKDMVFHHEVD